MTTLDSAEPGSIIKKSWYTINGVAKKGWVAQHKDRLWDAARKAGVKARQVGPRIEIIEDATGEVIDVVPLHSNNERHAERVEDGLSINMNHERFSTRTVLEES